MTTEEEQQRLRLELTALSTDLAKGLQGLTFMVSANRDAIDIFRGWMQEVEQDDHMFARIDQLENTLLNLKDVPARVAMLEKIASGIETGNLEGVGGVTGEGPVRSSQWKFYVALVVVAIPGVVAFAMKLVEIWPRP
jgi:hypothetical protein